MEEALGEALVGEVVESDGELVCVWFSWGWVRVRRWVGCGVGCWRVVGGWWLRLRRLLFRVGVAVRVALDDGGVAGWFVGSRDVDPDWGR